MYVTPANKNPIVITGLGEYLTGEHPEDIIKKIRDKTL
jgi:hypothetical protein